MAERERMMARATATDQPALVSIVTINYNQPDLTRQFLDSARHLTYSNYEIIVVDNASTIPLLDSLDPAWYPRLRVVRSETNLGFTGGNNLGMAEATGDYFFIVNNDTELSPNLLEGLLEPFAQDNRIGVTCPKIRFFEPPNRVQYAGYNPVNFFTGTTTPIGLNQPDDGRFDQPASTYFAHGCAMLVSRRVVERVGRFAERFFLYYEELDWSQRIRDAGFLIYYQPTVSILHKESASVGQNSPLRTYYLTRNRILFVRRHAAWYQSLVFTLFFGTCVLPKHLLTYLLAGKLTHADAFLRGAFWNLTSPKVSPV